MTGVPFVDSVFAGVVGVCTAPLLLEIGLGWFWGSTRETVSAVPGE